MENSKEQMSVDYSNKVHRLGRITSIIVILALLAVPVLLSQIFGLKIEIGPTISATLAVLAFMVPTTLVELVSYAPLIGAGGQYLAFITGNVMNMKLPAAVSSVKLSGYEEGTPEADVISTIAIAVSSLVTMAILIVGLVIGSALLPVLQNPVLTPAFDNLMPAIIGALATPIFVKNIKGSIGPIVAGVILLLVMGATWYSTYQTYLILVFIFISIGWSYILYRYDNKKKDTL